MRKINIDKNEKHELNIKKEGESSKQGPQKNQRTSCSHYGKLGHT